jgi:hypothetical protein
LVHRALEALAHTVLDLASQKLHYRLDRTIFQGLVGRRDRRPEIAPRRF